MNVGSDVQIAGTVQRTPPAEQLQKLQIPPAQLQQMTAFPVYVEAISIQPTATPAARASTQPRR